MSRTVLYVHVNMILHLSMTFNNTSVLCQPDASVLYIIY